MEVKQSWGMSELGALVSTPSVCFAFAPVLLSLVVFLGCRQCWICPPSW